MQPGEKHLYTNQLIHESSPYLQQHAHNPVDWLPWSDDAFAKAEAENKLVLISIGYSSCHWCHVMEKECFEDEATAKLMNEKFVCIKVDREERPDIDQIYMSAVQLINGSGGWPLNCFTLPDKRPLSGGTYFPKTRWNQALIQLSEFYKNNQEQAKEYAEELSQGMIKTELLNLSSEKKIFSKEHIEEAFQSMKKTFDTVEGGPNRAPKFPMPVAMQFLLNYYSHTKDPDCLKQIDLTLEKMAFGGIYDQLSGGFARYSTDSLWKVPHFEKMLYDNAQLVSLYSDAFRLTKNPVYKEVVYETLEWISSKMTSSEGGFYSAMDADSEGEEGKYYVWKKEELQTLLDEKSFPVFCDHYNVNETGFWEHGNYILLRKRTAKETAEQHHLSETEFRELMLSCKKTLLNEREKRIPPLLDDKILTSWNGLMGKAYADAYLTFRENKFLETAEKNAGFILAKLTNRKGELLHVYKNGSAKIEGFLEDYCFIMESFIALYQCNFEEKWLLQAKRLADFVVKHFQDKKSGMFFFTSGSAEEIITRKIEIQDNVIASANSSIAKSLFQLSHYFDNENYRSISEKMLQLILPEATRSSPWYANWGIVLMNFIYPFYEIVMTGNEALSFNKKIGEHYFPNSVLTGKTKNEQSDSPLLKDRWQENKTLIYVCRDNTCELPVSDPETALRLLA